jgi:hypothetical protein
VIPRKTNVMAMTWARNHVVESIEAYQWTVPNAKKSVATKPAPRLLVRRVVMRQHRPTLIAPMITPTSCEFVARPKIATKGISTTAGSGGNGSRPKPGSPGAGITSWK